MYGGGGGGGAGGRGEGRGGRRSWRSLGASSREVSRSEEVVAVDTDPVVPVDVVVVGAVPGEGCIMVFCERGREVLARPWLERR